MESLSRIVGLIDNITERLGKVIAWLTLLMVLFTFAIVVLRYGFNLGWIGMQESVLYLHGIVFMLGAGYTLKADGHVRVDIYYQNFSKLKKAYVNFFGTLFLLLPVCVFIFFISLDYVLVSWEILEHSPEAGGLPIVYISKTLLLLLPFTLALQGLSELMRNLLFIISQRTQEAN